MLISPYVLNTKTFFSALFTLLYIWIGVSSPNILAMGNAGILQSIGYCLKSCGIVKSKFEENLVMLEVAFI